MSCSVWGLWLPLVCKLPLGLETKLKGEVLKMSQKSSAQHQPLLTRYAVPRSAGQSMPGGFSKEKNVWVVNCDGKEVPVILSHGMPSEMITKTNNYNEQDDESPFFHHELITKTDVQSERDDSDFLYGDVVPLSTKMAAGDGKKVKCSVKLNELSTKTEVDAESDDEFPFVDPLIELLTKTKVDEERDDEDGF